MAGRMSQQVRADPNLTPMLDMVFQLITFFVMVMTFKSAEIDFNLSLPVVGSARPVRPKGARGLLVLNVDRPAICGRRSPFATSTASSASNRRPRCWRTT